MHGLAGVRPKVPLHHVIRHRSGKELGEEGGEGPVLGVEFVAVQRGHGLGDTAGQQESRVHEPLGGATGSLIVEGVGQAEDVLGTQSDDPHLSVRPGQPGHGHRVHRRPGRLDRG